LTIPRSFDRLKVPLLPLRFSINLEVHPLAPTPVPLRGDHITLVQAVKVVGLAESGGQAKRLVREGGILVNGVAEPRPGRKLVAGDRFALGEQEWLIQR
jgi:ribosome-associated protein